MDLDNDDDLELDLEATPKKGGGVTKIIIISILAIVLLGGTVAVTLMMVGGDKKEHVDSEEESESDEEEDEEKPKKKNGKKDKKKDKKKKKPKKKKRKKKSKKVKKRKIRTPYYMELPKPVVVNLDGSSGVRFLQVKVALMVYKERDVEVLKKHLPMIQHHLVLLFSSQNFSELQTVAGKNKLMKTVLETLRKELDAMIGDPVVEAVYLPSIIGQ